MKQNTKQQLTDFEKQYNKITYQKRLSVKRVKQLKYDKENKLISKKEFNIGIAVENKLRRELNKTVRLIYPSTQTAVIPKVKTPTAKPVKFTFPQGERKQSNGERLVENYLKQNNITYEAEKQFDDMLGVSNHSKLSIDFYLPELYIAIEFDGAQHYDSSYYMSENLYKTAWANDRKKDFYCQTKGIKMIRIRHYEVNKIAEILDREIE